MVYYNEFDPKTAAWLRELIRAGLIADGVVDERSITDVRPDDVRGYTQCHFFAGIGGWSLALRLAGWPDDEPVWTGSAPCQPWSLAGNQDGEDDERDLCPVYRDLIAACRPSVAFGEQVESAIGLGWLDRLEDDMETEGYTAWPVVLGSHSVGAPHIRDRLYWAASDATAFRACRLEPAGSAGAAGPWWPSGPQDMQAILERPFAPGPRWPQPLLRAGDDGLSSRVVGVRGAGNAIQPQVAAAFIRAFVESVELLR